MIHKRVLHAALASALLIGGTAPVLAQGFLDRMKEDAQRRAENKAVRDAENPPPAKPAATATTADAPAQSATAAPAAPAPTAPAETESASATPPPAQ